MPHDRAIYLNMPVADLDRSMAFFQALGFEFDLQFTDEKCASLIIGEKAYVMLLTCAAFEEFIPGKTIADATATAEVLVAVSAPDREAVDTMVRGAVAGGGSEYREAADHGWMYFRAFQDLDGHIWEVLAIDETLVPGEPDEGSG